jgi:hypothetical protein
MAKDDLSGADIKVCSFIVFIFFIQFLILGNLH